MSREKLDRVSCDRCKNVIEETPHDNGASEASPGERQPSRLCLWLPFQTIPTLSPLVPVTRSRQASRACSGTSR